MPYITVGLTFPSSSIPRLLNLVPALRHDRREISVNQDGSPDLEVRRGAEEGGIVIVATNPRIADVNILELSRASFSREAKRERNLTRGPIMYAFHKYDSSRLSISNSKESTDLIFPVSLDQQQ
jgi:hypothetical protein